RQAIIDSKRYTTLHQKWDLYIPFVEFGLQSLAKNGLLTMIIPYPFTNQIYGKKLRKLIVNQYNLIEIVDLNGTKIFENATVNNCIPFVAKNKNKTGSCFISKMNDKRKITRSFRQPFTNLIQDKNTIVWNLTSEKRTSDKHSDMNILGDYCYISKGMVLNADEKIAKGEFAKNDLISNKRDKIHCRKYIEAKDIEKYAVKKIRYLEYNTERCPDRLSRPTFRELYNCKKLMFNRFGSLMVYLDDKTKFLHSDSMFSAVLWKDLKGVQNQSIAASISRYSRLDRDEMESLSQQVDLRYLLGILNSKYAAVLLTNIRGNGLNIYPEHLRNLPIPAITLKKQQPIISLVNKIIAAKSKKHNANTTKLESKIDSLVYKLYGLTEDEIKIVEG
ncbi:MAG: Eco57I restriction-modification methylase domain-containing protein, partial [Planctomycetaceae bacterium]|nr:Eco57I restriction-modification methylase domain-containing protein [Planctomycetaceae bacterium]